ncbi:MAG: regulatory protein RecX [Acutalibacteraceae bacterium]
MKIVSVKAQKQHLYEVTLDDGQQGQIDKTVWEQTAYGEGTAVDDEQWEALCRRSQEHRARERALYYLSLRDYGSGELTSKLCRAGFDRALSQQTVEKLCRAGLVDDARYAAMLARDMQGRKLYPRRRIAMVLREKGFPAQAIEEALEALPDREEQQALELLYKKRYNGANDQKQREKALGMLARYGFSYAVSRRALEEWEREQTEQETE